MSAHTRHPTTNGFPCKAQPRTGEELTASLVSLQYLHSRNAEFADCRLRTTLLRLLATQHTPCCCVRCCSPKNKKKRGGIVLSLNTCVFVLLCVCRDVHTYGFDCRCVGVGGSCCGGSKRPKRNPKQGGRHTGFAGLREIAGESGQNATNERWLLGGAAAGGTRDKRFKFQVDSCII